ncbi:MAG: T9SS type A sorting domain-containing protein, partial [Bacteroidales bacterium]|nr:T9SS type A sorting domain-containing protein [Bacteroidales bacterium]
IVTSNDNCGESEMTSHHRTMHLYLEAGQNGNQTLNWTHYEGFQYDTYKIYRGANPFAMEQIGEVPSDQNSFTDNTSDRSYCYYQIQISNANNNDIVAKSNIVGTILSSIEGYVSNLSVFPNPATTTLNITSSETIASIEIFSATGQSVLQTNVNGDSTTCDIKHLASGIYLIVAHDSNGKIGLAKFTKE